MLRSALIFAACAIVIPLRAHLPCYRDKSAETEARVDDLLARLTLDEKLELLGGDGDFHIRPIPRLGLPAVKMADGPLGVRNWGKAPAYPATVALAASWDPALAHDFGVSLGRDSRARGVHILLGPAVNIQRLPMNGRNFEYLTEDPALAAALAVPIVDGIQSQGVVATVKHYAVNSQETERNTINELVSERALREIYLPAFRAAVEEGHAWAVMNAYNRVNDCYCTASDWLNHTMLKGEWRFPGVLMSDWNAVHETLGVANGGLDLEMPSGEFLTAAKLKPLLDSGAVALATIDDKVRRILRLEIANGFLDRPQTLPDIPRDDPRSAAVALQIAREGAVLLKNEGGLLPFDRRKIKSLLVVGPNADTYVAGGGSSHVGPFHSISVLDGLRQIAGPGVRIEHLPSPGAELLTQLLASARYTAPLEFTLHDADWAKPKLLASGTDERVDRDWSERGEGEKVLPDSYVARWHGFIQPPKAGRYVFLIESTGSVSVKLDGGQIIGTWQNPDPQTFSATVALEAGKSYGLDVSYAHDTSGRSRVRFAWGAAPPVLSDAEVERIRAADAVVVCAGFNLTTEGEGSDRSYELPGDQPELIRRVAALNPRTALVINAGGSVATADWIGQTPAVLHAWYPGQEGGRAIAEILFGDVNPSGKLPFSYEKRWEDCAAYGNFPGVGGKVTYAEDIFVGYRWFDHRHIVPLFPFGFGLSYTSFKYDHLALTPTADGGWVVKAEISNVGTREGAEVAQVYVAAPAGKLVRPVRELKGFNRVTLKPGQTKTVAMTLPRSAFACFDEKVHAWVVPPGAYTLEVGASSCDLPLTASVEVK